MHILLVGKSGAGKSTIAKYVSEKIEGVHLVKSFTTRERRDGEDDTEYNFIPREEFEIFYEERDKLVEHVEYKGNKYGIPAEEFNYKHTITAVTYDGARQLVSKLRGAIIIYIDADYETRLGRVNEERRNEIISRKYIDDTLFKNIKEKAFYTLNNMNGRTLESIGNYFNELITKQNEEVL